MNGTTAYTASPKSVKVSTSFERSQSFYSIGIQNGIRWLTAETGEYGSATKSNIVVTTSAFKTFDLDSGSVFGWTPIGAQGIHTSYLAVSSNSFTLIEEKETNITF